MPTDPRTIQAYNQHAEVYNAHVLDPADSIFHAYYEKPALRAELPDLQGLDVLSLGCGSGVDAQWLADNDAANVTGIDISSGLIDIAKREHTGINFQVMDMETLDLANNSFDVACSSLAIHYLDDMTKSLKETYRVLKPSGLYVFSCGHPLNTAVEYYDNNQSNGTRLGRIVIKETGERIIHGDYMATTGGGTRIVEGHLGDLDVQVYHRTFSVMLDQIQASGFTIEKMVEPQPTEDMKQANIAVYDQLIKIPSFMIWVLRKQQI